LFSFQIIILCECSGDNLKLEPMCGELKPNTHMNIKMTLTPSKYPTYFEGEIQCSIDWESNGQEHMETKSVHTNTNVPDSSEYLFLRMKKRSKIVRHDQLLLNYLMGLD
jgi:hypothetical protein